MYKDKFNVPVLLIVFNRPDTTFKVFEQIKKCKPSKFFISADGPREGVAKDKEKCNQVREIIGQVDWNCEVKTLLSEHNLGCKIAVSSAIDWFFKSEEKGIILEDDTLPHPTFFRFCEELLEYYKDNKRIMMISGDNFQFGRTFMEYSYYFSSYTHIWGWATWRRAWNYYDVDMKLWPKIRDGRLLFNILDNKKEVSYWKNIFEMVYKGGKNTWDYQWLFSCWLQSGLTIVPRVNLVSNIGFGEMSAHTKEKSILANLESKEIIFPLLHPPYVSRNVIADKFDDKTTFSSKPLYKKIVNKIYSLLDGFRINLSSSIVQGSGQCPSCGHGKISVYSRALPVWRCLSCGLLFKDISLSESIKIYKNAWSDLRNHKDETGATTPELARIYSKKLIKSLGLRDLAGLKILDFGAGRGDMLIALSELGADVYGVELFGYEYLKSKNLTIFRQIEEIPKGLLFDGIIANDVIEHLFYPWDAIKQLYGLLNSNGWLYIATPNAKSFNAKVFRSRWREFYNSGHIRFFNSSCIELIFTKLGIVRYKRLNWFVKYRSNPLAILTHFVLQLFQLDGVLRYILRKY